MSEINENVQNETQETANAENQQIEIKEPGKVKKALKWVIGGVVVVLTGIAGILLGRGMGKDDDDDSAEAEAPTEE